MIAYVLYYYDRPLLDAWFNHYCHLPSIEEIIIQNQNWSAEDTLYLHKKAAEYVDQFNRKIVILPSTYRRVDGASKREQFKKYGQPSIRNRVLQFLKGKTFLTGAMDEAIYDADYPETNRRLTEFEKLAEERAADGWNTAGYLELFSVCPDGIYPGQYCHPRSSPTWKNRLNRFTDDFAYMGLSFHHEAFHVFAHGYWREYTHPTGYHRLSEIPEEHVVVPLRVLHYQSLIRPSTESADYTPPKEIKQLDKQPIHYVEKLK